MKIKEAVAIASQYSKCPPLRLFAMADELHRLDEARIPGDIVECGVWKGGSIILARLVSPERMCWLYDTFNGMANPSKWDVTRGGKKVHEGKAAVSVDDVIANLKATGTHDQQRLRFIPGQVEITLEFTLPDKIALLHLDTDWYHSTKMELNALWPRVERQGTLIIDDYGHWKGARKAVDEYFAGTWSIRRKIDQTAIVVIKP